MYWPEFGFNGIGDLIHGQGYQVKLEEAYETVGLDRKARAEQITIEQYIQLAETLLA